MAVESVLRRSAGARRQRAVAVFLRIVDVHTWKVAGTENADGIRNDLDASGTGDRLRAERDGNCIGLSTSALEVLRSNENYAAGLGGTDAMIDASSAS
jgi:hypothetical protein